MSYNVDPNEMKTCPYDSSHKISASRFQTHLIKCRKSHPEKARTLETCPFNATHLISGTERDEHILKCPDNLNMIRSLKQQAVPINTPVVMRSSVKVSNNDDENWDDVDEPKVSIKLTEVDDEIKIEKVVPSRQSLPKISPPNKSARRDVDPDDFEEKPAKIISMGRGLWKKK